MHSIGSRGYEFASPWCIVEKNRLPESGWLCVVNSAGLDARVDHLDNLSDTSFAISIRMYQTDRWR
ncbi:hypothetical protein Memar_2119 [Methanoculleus marisnigri JR1]|uniref:Uncharacterized protein n=1 Tax=Methanoculleus marisnigri (strain ATCC 35101 / DSM 1498 / JR1) TaxID=368407 RepID=A3CXE3_METMJ|nr:hypothetical protein Memar_2119 [Methanoculleus marisnigri JR1]